MSTKIYDGFRFVSSDLTEIHGQLLAYRPVVKQAVADAKCRFLADTAARLIDRAALEGVAAREPLSASCREMRERQREVRLTGYRDAEIDFEFKLAVMPFDGRVYGIPYCNQREWKAAFMAQPWVEPWPYWNDSDGPNGLTQAEWKARGETWNAVLAVDEWDRPVGCGFTYDFEPPPREPDEHEVLAFVHSREDRASSWARDFVHDAQWRRMLDERGLKDDDRQAISLVLAVERAVRGEAGEPLRAAERKRIMPLLPEITAEVLLGWSRNAPPPHTGEQTSGRIG